MTVRKPVSPSPFRTASDILKKDTGKSENRRRLDSWADVLIRNKKIASSWKDDEEIADLVRSITDPKAEVPGREKARKPKTAGLKR